MRKGRKLLFTIFVLGNFISGNVAAQVNCEQIALSHIDAFVDHPMEIENVDTVTKNPCNGKLEQAAVELKPGEGRLTLFLNGDLFADLERYTALACRDGRAFVRNVTREHVICDTR